MLLEIEITGAGEEAKVNQTIDFNAATFRFSSCAKGGHTIDSSDYLGWMQQPKFVQMLGQCKVVLNIVEISLEKLLFSDKIKKINMFNWVQERYFIITTNKIYNVKKSKVKRSIVVRGYFCLIQVD
jgi:hypothetical protein